jgi:hypothetical protein
MIPCTKCYTNTDNRVFKTRYFHRTFKCVDDQIWCDAVQEMSHGLIDAQLGRSIVKKRVAINGKGKRSGARTIVATKKEDRWFFVYGFIKNEQANISTKELAAFRELADLLLSRTDSELDEAVAQNELVEICHD